MSVVHDVSGVHVLRLHSDAAGHIWFGDDYTPGECSGLSVDEFFSGQESQLGFDLRTAQRLRVLGIRQNAALIVRLYDTISHNGLRSPYSVIELGSPVVCPTNAVLTDPEAVMHYLWQPEPVSALHVLWHTLGKHDYCTYSLISCIDKANKITDHARHIVRYHPAWPALTFAIKPDLEAACATIANIVDARWFHHYGRANRLSKLFAYLGITPQNVRAFFQLGNPGRHFDRALRAIATWYNRASVIAYNTGNCVGPEAYLWRVYASHRDPEKGVLRGTEQMLRLVNHVWLNAVMPPHPEVGFSSSQFFRYATEAKAFEKHSVTATKLDRPGKTG